MVCRREGEGGGGRKKENGMQEGRGKGQESGIYIGGRRREREE